MLSPDKLIQFKKIFWAMKKDILAHREILAAGATQGDDAEIAQEEREQHLQAKLLGRQMFFLKKIDDALVRINDGSFGECVECDAEIAEERLLARPMTNLCIHCKEEQERDEDKVLYHRKSHTRGREIKLITGESQHILTETGKPASAGQAKLLSLKNTSLGRLSTIT